MYPFVRPNPLQELMSAIESGGESPVVGGGGGFTSPAGGGGAAAVDPMVAVLARLAAPQPTPETPQVVQPSKKQRLLAAFADALGAYGSLSAGVAPQPMATAGLYGRREREAKERESVRYGKARAAAEADRQSALLEYQRLQEQKAQTIRAQELADARKEAERRDRVVSSRFIAEEQGKNIRQERDIEADRELAELKGELKVEEVKAKPVKPGKPDPNIAKQQKKAEEVMKFISGATAGLNAELAKGAMEPDDVRRTLQREMDARNLDGEDRQRVINFFIKHIHPILKKYDAPRVGG